MDKFMDFFIAAVLASTPFLFGTLGEILTEKSGNLNLGVEGMMFMGGAGGLAGAYYYEQLVANPNGWVAVLVGMVCAILFGALGAFLYSVLTVSLRANQNVTGLALTIFGAGFGNFFGEMMGVSAGGFVSVGSATKEVFKTGIPFLQDIPVLGKLFFSYNFMVYLAIAMAVLLAWFLRRTRTGLNLRAVGESPDAADAASINVTRYKYLATCIGGGICGLGGMYIIMAQYGGVWVHNAIGGKGWIAVALVIFATWSPSRALLGSLIFGGLSVLRLYFPFGGASFISLYDSVPYLATIVVLVGVSLRKRRESQPPANLGLAYFREER